MVSDRLFLVESPMCIVSVPPLLYKVIRGSGVASAVHIISLRSATFGFVSEFPWIVNDLGESKI